MRVTIIVPVFNKELYVNSVLSNIADQTLADFECLVIDDGSTDMSGKICDAFAARDSRFQVFHIPNGGLAHARNLGLEKAAGQYITFVDADDHIEPDYLQQLYADIENSKADMVIAGLQKFWKDERLPAAVEVPYRGMRQMAQLLPEFAAVQQRTGIYGYSCAKLVRRELISDIRFSEWLHLAEDFEFYLRVYPKVKTVFFDDQCKYYYLQEAENSSTIVKDDNIDYMAQLKLNLIYRDFLIKIGYWNEKNRAIVEQMLTDYAFFTVFHANRDSVPDVVRRVHNIVTDEKISMTGKGLWRGSILRCIKEDDGLKAKRLLELYDCLRSIKRKSLYFLRNR